MKKLFYSLLVIGIVSGLLAFGAYLFTKSHFVSKAEDKAQSIIADTVSFTETVY